MDKEKSMLTNSETDSWNLDHQDLHGTVYVVENDQAARESVVTLIEAHGLNCIAHDSAESYLNDVPRQHPGCLLLDHVLPGMDGLELQSRLLNARDPIPIIVVSGYVDIRLTVKFMQRGALTILEKPCEPDEMVSAIRKALHCDTIQQDFLKRFRKLTSAIDALTSREFDILQRIANGDLNKNIASSLDVSVRTVESDRARIVEKFGAESSNEVVARFAEYNFLNDLNSRFDCPQGIVPPNISLIQSMSRSTHP